MSTFEKIVQAIKDFGYPYSPDVYQGKKEDGWFTYNYSTDRGGLYGDDEPGTIVVGVQVHWYLPLHKNFQDLKNQVRRALLAQGFTYPSITVLTEEGEKLRHIVFECEIEEEGGM